MHSLNAGVPDGFTQDMQVRMHGYAQGVFFRHALYPTGSVQNDLADSETSVMMRARLLLL
jgi:hypothetical protein